MAYLALGTAAYTADLAPPGGGHPQALADVAVGGAFGAAGLLSTSPPRQRLLIANVGVWWLAASLLPIPSWHQAALLAALLTFPTGRAPTRRVALALLVLGAVLLLGWLDQGATALVFLAVSLALGRTSRRDHAHAYPSAAAALMALVLLGSWAVQAAAPTRFDPRAALLVYETTLCLVAIGHVAAARLGASRSRRRLGTLLADHRTDPALRRRELLESMLRDLLRDPGLRIRLTSDAGDALDTGDSGDTDELGPASARSPVWRSVRDGDAVVAELGLTVPHWDPVTVSTAEHAVRLLARSLRLQTELEREVRRLEDVRRRLLTSEQRQRTWLARRLDGEVLGPLRDATTALGQGASRGEDLDVEVARGQVEAAASEVQDVVAGVPRDELGDGSLVRALQDVAARAPCPVTVLADEDARGDSRAETTLYYVCAEAVTNVAKHARATAVQVRLFQVDGELELVVEDDGCGGADPAGYGLLGLRDRLEAAGGKLRIRSPEGAGTTVRATCPTRSCSTDR